MFVYYDPAEKRFTSDEYASAMTDELITHWQSPFSSGLGTGLHAPEEVARRIEACLSDRLEWKSAEEIMQLMLSQPDQHLSSHFDN